MRFSHERGQKSLIPIAGLAWLAALLDGGLRLGGAYVLTGEPGGCKSTLCIQMLVALAACGIRVLLILSEQTPGEVAGIIDRVSRRYSARAHRAILRNLEYETLDRPEDLTRMLLPKLDREYRGVRVVVVDSVQGSGFPSTATRAYSHVFGFIDGTKSRGIASILISHMNKSNKLSGPRAFEHKVDVVLHLRKAFKLRNLFIAKNRFGPERVDAFSLELIEGRLEPSPHQGDHCAVVVGYDVRNDELLELQATITLPKLGRRGELNAAFLPRQRLKAISSMLSRLPDVDLSGVDYTLNAYVPCGFCYSGELDLPLSIAMLGAYLRRSVPTNILLIGQVDLRRQVRPPRRAYAESLMHVMDTAIFAGIRQIIVSSAAAGLIGGELSHGSRLQVCGVATLDELIHLLWPDLYEPATTKRIKTRATGRD